jgi:hypothetical protein
MDVKSEKQQGACLLAIRVVLIRKPMVLITTLNCESLRFLNHDSPYSYWESRTRDRMPLMRCLVGVFCFSTRMMPRNGSFHPIPRKFMGLSAQPFDVTQVRQLLNEMEKYKRWCSCFVVYSWTCVTPKPTPPCKFVKICHAFKPEHKHASTVMYVDTSLKWQRHTQNCVHFSWCCCYYHYYWVAGLEWW